MGAEPGTTVGQLAEIDTQETFVAKLTTFRDEIERIATFGIRTSTMGCHQLRSLWRLVPQHRAWQKECKECWDSLAAGEYDWANLAMHLWPERVVPKVPRGSQPGNRPRIGGPALDGRLREVAGPRSTGRRDRKPEEATAIKTARQLRRELDALAGDCGAGVSPPTGAGKAAAKRAAAELWKKLEAGDMDDTAPPCYCGPRGWSASVSKIRGWPASSTSTSRAPHQTSRRETDQGNRRERLRRGWRPRLARCCGTRYTLSASLEIVE